MTALAWTISVYRRAWGASNRWNTRQWVSVQSIIGATDSRIALAATGLEIVSRMRGDYPIAGPAGGFQTM